jgi:hypothetical protein
VGPDGAIYVCDWYNPIIGHYQASYRDPKRDKIHGRIWRFTAIGRPTLTKPIIAPENAVALLKSPERWVRDHVKQSIAAGSPAAQAVKH